MKRLRFVLLIPPAAAAAQVSERIEVHVVEVPAIVRDAAGNVPPDLTPADFELRENGVVQKIVAVDYLGGGAAQAFQPALREKADRNVRTTPRGETVIYLQQSLMTTAGLRQSAGALAAQADALVRSADVEVVSDFPGIHELLRPTSNSAELRTLLEDVAAHAHGEEAILRMRQTALTVAEPKTPAPGGPGTTAGALDALAEQDLIRRTQLNFLQWMSRYPRAEQGRSRTLILVADGFDYDQSFYDKLYKTQDVPVPLGHDSRYPAFDQDRLSRTLAAQGWTVYCIAPGKRWMESTMIVENHPSLDALLGQSTLLQHVLDPLLSLADEWGGLVETDRTKVGSDLDKLAQRVILAYQVRRPRDDVVRRIEIRPLRKGLTVVATRWSTLGTPESLAVRVDLSSIDALRAEMHAATLRVAIAVAPERTMPFTMTQRMDALDLAAHAQWELTFPIHARRGAPAAVSVEEPSSGAWGGARYHYPADAARPHLPCEVGADLPDERPERGGRRRGRGGAVERSVGRGEVCGALRRADETSALLGHCCNAAVYLSYTSSSTPWHSHATSPRPWASRTITRPRERSIRC